MVQEQNRSFLKTMQTFLRRYLQTIKPLLIYPTLASAKAYDDIVGYIIR